MKIINWNDLMLSDLKEMKPSAFSKKYDISLPTIMKKRIELGLVKKDTNKPSIQVEEKQPCILDKVSNVISDIEGLINKGVKFYLSDLGQKLNVPQQIIEDVVHVLEDGVDTMNDKTLIECAKSIGYARRHRRTIKDERMFITENQITVSGFVDFMKKINSARVAGDSYIYKPRIMDIGKLRGVKGEGDNESVLKEKIASLENQLKNKDTSNGSGNESYALKLMKENIKLKRQDNRIKKEIVYIDELEKNWKQMFNNNVDEVTRNSILNDLRLKVLDKDMPTECKEWYIMNVLLPKHLFENEYFIKK